MKKSNIKIMYYLSLIVLLLQVASFSYAKSDEPTKFIVKVNSGEDSPFCQTVKKELQLFYTDHEAEVYSGIFNTGVIVNDHFGFYPILVKKDIKLMGLQGQTTTANIGYYLIDINNDGHLRLVDKVTGGYLKYSGWGSLLTIYKKNWLDLPQPISVKDREVDYYIGSYNYNILKENGALEVMYFIYPFFYKEKNYLLINFDGSDKYGLFIVGELINRSELITHCRFKLKSKYTI